jgi:hypothetical protein
LKVTLTQEFDNVDILGYNNALKRFCYVDDALMALSDIRLEIRSHLKHDENVSDDEEQFLSKLLELTILRPPEI